MSQNPSTLTPAAKYDQKMARWRTVVDAVKHRPWVLKLVDPLSRGRGRWRVFDRFDKPADAPHRPDFSNWSNETFAACWIGHATVLLRVGGVTILTDPVFATRVGLGWGFGTLGPARFIKPAVPISSLPPIDLILLSHAHFDHLDRPSLHRLPKRSTVICADRISDLVNDLGFERVHELKLNESMQHAGLKITAIPTRHWGARMVLDGSRGYCAYLIETPTRRVLFGGDSAFQEFWKPIGESGGTDLTIVGIGAYDPWIGGHANPEQAWQMAMDSGARRVLPMHHLTFKLSNEPMDDPLKRLLIAAGDRASDVVGRAIGEVWRGDA